ncbi:MAG: SpoIIE family protein phosphatase [Planctomycetes bacterium]|nr:SpoIIE family protein phosphatase [Planctomycetota bacterium]
MSRSYSFSAAGGHPVNEDAFILRQLPREEGWLVALADGQGGRAGGRRAAQLACEVAIQRALLLRPEQRADGATWAEVLSLADAAVATDREAGLATLVGLCAGAGHVAGASCGDSAAVAVCGDSAPRVLTSRQFKNPPVGSGEATFVPFEMELTPPWRLLAISDGVWKYASWDRVWDCAARLSGEELIEELQQAARLKTSGEFPDDFTAVLLESE